MKINTTEIGKMTKEMETVNLLGKMEIHTKENGKIIKRMDKGYTFVQMEMCTKGNGKATVFVEGEYLNGQTGTFLKESGITINGTDKECPRIQIKRVIVENGNKTKKKGRGEKSGTMVTSMSENGRTICEMGWVPNYLLTVISMSASGARIS